MSNCGYCSVIVKEKDSVNELLEILDKNFDASRGESFLALKFYDEKYDWHYTALSIVKVENTTGYIRFETEFRRFDAVCTYLKLRGIDFIYEFTDEQHGMGGLTNDMTGEFFKTWLCVVFDDMDDVDEVTVDIPIGATDEYIESKIKEIEEQYNKKAFHSYAIEYCPDDYFTLDENNRKNCEKSIEAILNGEPEEKADVVNEEVEDNIVYLDESPF